MKRSAATILLLLASACAAPPPPAPTPAPAPPVADDHPAVIAVPREPVASQPLAAPGRLFDSQTIRPAAPATAAAPARPAPARLGPARAGDLVGAWRVMALPGEDAAADLSPAAAVFVVLGADGALAEIVLEDRETPPANAAELRRLAARAAPGERWALDGAQLRVTRAGGFAPESWTVERVEAAGPIGAVAAQAGDVLRTLAARGDGARARQLLRRLPGAPGA